MSILCKLTLLCFLILPGISSAQCHQSSATIDIDSIFNFWSSQKKLPDIDGIIDETMSLDTIILFGDSTSTMGSFHLILGNSNGGMNFSYNGTVPLNVDSFFSGSFLGEENPFDINMNFDNMYRLLEEIFQDFKGIEVIPQPEKSAPGTRPVYRI